MAKSSGLNTTGILSRVTVAAVTAALVGTTTAAVAADQPQPRTAVSAKTSNTKAPSARTLAVQSASAVADGELRGVDSTGTVWAYLPNGRGGFDERQNGGYGWKYTNHFTMADQNGDGHADGVWGVTGGRLHYTPWGKDTIDLGAGWGVFDKVVSVGNLGGAVAADLLTRDAAGNLYLYLGYGNGKFAPRVKVGTGWSGMNQLTGKGDLNNDGKNDLIARDKSGNLWVYPGTGDYKKPFGNRYAAGTGWNSLPTFVSSGDVDFDGVTDVVARDAGGTLWLYPGTGVKSPAFKARTKIGTGWNTYRVIF